MRPYITVILDCFHAAFASRLLWIALLGVAIFLLCLAPIGYNEGFVATFSDDLVAPDRLVTTLAQGLKTSALDSPSHRIAKALPESIQKSILATVDEHADPPDHSKLVKAFNGLLDQEDEWYDVSAWKGTIRLKEQRSLESMPDDQTTLEMRQRRARLRLEGALPGTFRPRPNKSIALTYLYWEFPIKLPVNVAQFQHILSEQVVPRILKLVLGIGGIMVGILVTSSILPSMLHGGSLHLLLSKPISRSWLYLATFVGGCAFVLVCVVSLITGLWLILGFRLDFWNHRLLLSIPLFMLLFSVYFSVSALSSLWWRSAIVSVAITGIFAALCSVVGVAADLFDNFVVAPDRVTGLAINFPVDPSKDTGPTILAGRRDTNTQYFHLQDNAWQALTSDEGEMDYQIIGPVFLDANYAVVAKAWTGRHGFGSKLSDLMIMESKDNWKPQRGGFLPKGTGKLLPTSDGGVLALGTNGLFFASRKRLVASVTQKSEQPKKDLLGRFSKLFRNQSKYFVDVSPQKMKLGFPRSITGVPESDDLVVCSRGRLLRLVRQPKTESWSVTVDQTVEGKPLKQAILAASANAVALIRQEEPIRIYKLDSLQPVGEIALPPRQMVVAAIGTSREKEICLLLGDGRLAKIDPDTVTLTFPDIQGQGNVEAISYANNGTLVIVFDTDQIAGFQGDEDREVFHYSPNLSAARKWERYLVSPLHTLVPATGNLSGDAVSATITGTLTEQLRPDAVDGSPYRPLEFVRPVANCSLFVCVMLALGCLHMYRQDF